MASIPPLQPSSKPQSVESFLDALAGPLLDRSRLGRPALGFGYYEGEILDPRWPQALADWARSRGLFSEHLPLADLGESPTRRILARQRVGEHLFSIEVRLADLPDAALQQPTPVADLNIHRDTFRDERLCLLIWVPRERARRFLELASNLVDYRTVDLDVPPFPEETPPVKHRQQLAPRARHNLPMARLGQQFIGREEEIARVQAMLLAAGSGAITDALALEGLGGIGKTRLAVEYAWDHLADYDWVFFLRADTMETLRANLARLADHEWLDLPEAGETEDERRVRAVLRWFEGHERWLLILDNADSEQSAGYIASEILPSLHRGHVLLTTRFRRWGGEVRALALAPLSESEAVRLLVTATEGQRRSLPDDPESAAALARALDGLPLALEQIAAWVRAQHCSFTDALAAVTAEDSAVLAWYDPRELRYPLPVAAVWERALEPLGAADHFLLRFLAWLAPAPVPDFLVQALNVIWQDQEDGTDFVGLARGLSERSLLTARSDRAFLLHRLSLELERRRTPRPERTLWDSRVAEVLSTVVPKETVDVRTWPRLVLLQPHASDLFTRTEPLVPTTALPAGDTHFASHLSTLLNQFGVFLHAKAEFSTAEPLLHRALAIMETILGEEHPNVATALNNLAQLLNSANRLEDAEPLMRRALAIDERRYGSEHPEVATDLNNLAGLLQATNRLEAAELLMRRALEIDEQSYGPEHPNVAGDLNNLAALLQDTNRLEEAEPLVRRALAIVEKSLGEEHPNVATTLNNLAQLLQATNRLEEAEPLMRRALAIDEQSYGPEHPDVAIDLNNLAQLFKATNRLKDAEPLMRRALAIDEQSYGPEHPKVAIRLNNLAGLLQDTNRLEEAKPLMRRTLAIDEQSYGPEHPDVAIDLNNLAQLLQATNRLEEAEPLSRRHLAIFLDFTRRAGHPHPHLNTALANYAGILRDLGRSEAEIQTELGALSGKYGIELPR